MIAADQAIERVLPLPMRYAFSGVRPSSGNATRIWALFFCA